MKGIIPLGAQIMADDEWLTIQQAAKISGYHAEYLRNGRVKCCNTIHALTQPTDTSGRRAIRNYSLCKRPGGIPSGRFAFWLGEAECPNKETTYECSICNP